MKKIVRNSARIVGMILIVLTLVAFLAWINNISILVQWIEGSKEVKEIEGGIIQRPTYSGSIPWLDWAAVDYSTVTTLIPFFGFLLMAIRCFQIANAKNSSNVSEYFPSFKYYETITVALGLIGTVWGLIMIGYYDMATLKNPELMMPELLKCMHTALYSTLVALVWVFVFVYPSKWVMPKAYRCVSGYQTGKSNENILSLLDNLGSATAVAADGVSKITDTVKGFNSQIVETKSRFKEIGDFLTVFKTGLTGIVSQMDSLLKVWQKTAEEEQKTSQQLQNLLRSFSSALSEEKQLREEAEKRAAEAEKVKNILHQTSEFFKKLLGNL